MTGSHQMAATRRTESRRVGEVAGNATAECAAVCCCVPCALLDMVVLAAYKVPAGLLKKALLKRENKKQLQHKRKNTNAAALLDNGPTASAPTHAGPRPTLEDHLAVDLVQDSNFEQDMWAQFNATGFWRSTSQRHQPHL